MFLGAGEIDNILCYIKLIKKNVIDYYNLVLGLSSIADPMMSDRCARMPNYYATPHCLQLKEIG